MPLGPGTWGSLGGLFLCLMLQGNIILYSLTFLALFGLGVVASDEFERETGIKDPSVVVIDEFACMFVVYLFVPLKLGIIVAAFLIYRVIDIVKFVLFKEPAKLPVLGDITADVIWSL